MFKNGFLAIGNGCLREHNTTLVEIGALRSGCYHGLASDVLIQRPHCEVDSIMD